VSGTAGECHVDVDECDGGGGGLAGVGFREFPKLGMALVVGCGSGRGVAEEEAAIRADRFETIATSYLG
jgi:hypothetical protein